MYHEFYRLTGLPFQLTPDPRFFYVSRVHKQALAYLNYGLTQAEGFIVVTGDIGAGKTTLVGQLLATLDAAKIVAAKIVTTQLEAIDLLRLAAAGYGIAEGSEDKSTLLRRLEQFFRERVREGKRVLLIVDEAQNLPMASVEELRMLSNFQVDNVCPFQCFLLGQPQFRAMLARPDLEQLRQRIIASYHLGPLAAGEVHAYIEHRLRLVGWQNDPAFAPEAYHAVHAHTGGVPRRINVLCSRIMLFGFLEGLHRIERAHVEQVASELEAEPALGPAVPVAPPDGGTPACADADASLGHKLKAIEAGLAALQTQIGELSSQMRRGSPAGDYL